MLDQFPRPQNVPRLADVLMLATACLLLGFLLGALAARSVCDRDPMTLTDAQYAACYAIEHDRWQP